jgi:hypothetical protein
LKITECKDNNKKEFAYHYTIGKNQYLSRVCLECVELLNEFQHSKIPIEVFDEIVEEVKINA